MGIFQHKQTKSDKDKDSDDAELFYDEYFSEELKNHARWYFEKIINENAELFKKDLDATITQVYTDLKDHLTTTLDQQFDSYGKTMKEAQDAALAALAKSTDELKDQHKQLGDDLRKHIADQEAILVSVSDENKAQLVALKDKQEAALQSINENVQALQQQQQEFTESLQKGAAAQKQLLVSTYEENTAQIIEHYLLGALGDQYDLKAQLPAIIKQMEQNKDAIVGDMQL